METTMAYSKKLSSKDGLLRINPAEVFVDFSENDRAKNNYGSAEKQAQDKLSIKNNGVLEPIRVYWDEEKGQYHLAHGFRRMKFVLELLNEGEQIATVPVIVLKSKNDENIKLDHFRLNSGEPLSDLSLSRIVKGLEGFGWKRELISEKTGLSYQAVSNLLKFEELASQETKKEVEEGNVAFHTALDVARQSGGDVAEQKKIIEEAKKIAEGGGKSKVTQKDVNKVTGKTKETSDAPPTVEKTDEQKADQKSSKEPERPTLKSNKKSDKDMLTELEAYLSSKVDINPEMFEILEQVIDYVDGKVPKEDLYKNIFQIK